MSDITEEFIRKRDEEGKARPNPLRDGIKWAADGHVPPTNPLLRPSPKKEDKSCR